MSGHWEALTAVGTVALAVVGFAALVFTWWQIRIQRSLGRIENLEKQIFYYDSPEFIKHRQALARCRLGQGRLKTLKDEDAPSDLYTVLNFFEHLSFLVRRHHIAAYDVWHSFGYWAFATYYDARRVIEYEQADDPTSYDDFVWLIGQLKRVERDESGEFIVPSDDDIYWFYCDEATGSPRAPQPRKRRAKISATLQTDRATPDSPATGE